ncbi:hypothetical protein WA026_014623 [Henosepilachna vigintioctopunctata]|uniref:Cap-specific mRNA (nucleoside-2'-O-)-methyltransferase 1 n=1 Tax=Henosepilachna vigintioctopunctata TaxID=420089 RepID=A0AAW1VGE5_9CUCU
MSNKIIKESLSVTPVNNTLLQNDDFTYSKTARNMMKKLGHKKGQGLGKDGKGIKEPINIHVQNNTTGLGFKEEETDKLNIQNDVEWLKRNESNKIFLSNQQLESFLKIGNPQEYSSNHYYCDEEVSEEIIKMKDRVFEQFRNKYVNARARANPFESIRNVFFINRAALKLANIDAATDFMFSNINENEHHKHSSGPFYFADVCAGPGGFSEYILWRKGWLFKGFGLTLKGKDDFRLNTSCCISPHSFQAFYGSAGDGNVCNPENIKDFKEKVLFQTNGLGVHFMTSDGGFCVDGEENNQEVLSKNIYLCQCLVALEIVRVHGHFVTKLFDVFTPFSVGLIYLMYLCFEKVCILKPKTSRPANAERYLICCNLQDSPNTRKIRKHLQAVSRILWEECDEMNDVLEIVSLDKMESDKTFIEYIRKSNNKLGKSQIDALFKLEKFCEFPSLSEHSMQQQLRSQCLRYWNVPDINKYHLKRKIEDDDMKLEYSRETFGWLKYPSMDARSKNSYKRICKGQKYSCCMMYSAKKQVCDLFAGFSSDTCKWQNGSWVIENKLNLTKGTLLYGEIVDEAIQSEDNNSSSRMSLHIIDAVCLGDKDMSKLPFDERNLDVCERRVQST